MLTCGMSERKSKLRSPLKPDRGIVEVLFDVAVEHEAEIRTPLMERPWVHWSRSSRSRRRRRSWCLSGRGGVGLRLNDDRASQERSND